MPQETQQNFLNLLKSSKGEINFRAPPAATSKQYKLSVMPFVQISELLCLNTPSNMDAEITTQMAVVLDKSCATFTEKNESRQTEVKNYRFCI